eukprot:367776-Rhodomonas_salina.1
MKLTGRSTHIRGGERQQLLNAEKARNNAHTHPHPQQQQQRHGGFNTTINMRDAGSYVAATAADALRHCSFMARTSLSTAGVTSFFKGRNLKHNRDHHHMMMITVTPAARAVTGPFQVCYDATKFAGRTSKFKFRVPRCQCSDPSLRRRVTVRLDSDSARTL